MCFYLNHFNAFIRRTSSVFLNFNLEIFSLTISLSFFGLLLDLVTLLKTVGVL